MLIYLQSVSQSVEGNAFSNLGFLVSEVLRLSSEVFRTIPTLSYSLPAALLVVFVAGFFQSLSQIVVLFINQVRPLRFVLSLLISALLFVVGYGFWALSTWTILSFVFDAQLPPLDILRALGFSYAPMAVFGAAVLLPYFGGGAFILLSIWTLLAVVVGLEGLAQIGRWDAFASAVLGWVVLQLLQKTVGQPIASLGQWITNWAAGEELVTNRMRLAQELYSGLRAQRASVDRLDTMSWQARARLRDNRGGKTRSDVAIDNNAQTWAAGQKKSASDTVSEPLDGAERNAEKKRRAAEGKNVRDSRPSLSQAILSRSLQDARERLRAENREQDR